MFECQSCKLLRTAIGGRLSADQIAVHDAMRRAGAAVSTVYDVDEALERLSEWGLLR